MPATSTAALSRRHLLLAGMFGATALAGLGTLAPSARAEARQFLAEKLAR